MSNKLYKILLILGIAATFTAISLFWLIFKAPAVLEVDFLDIGQGDSILIKAPSGQNILIDGGPDNTVIKRLSENLPWWDRTIDLMILTHPHDDHVSGLLDVIKRYRVKKILYTGVAHTSPSYLAWLELIRDKKIPLTIVDRPQTVNLAQDYQLKFLYPQESFLGRTIENLNNSSIVIRLIYGQTGFLFSGDIEQEGEEKMLKDNINLSSFVYKAGHHGSDTSSSEDFLRAVSPEITVIQVGEDNEFGQPSRRVLKRLERAGSQIFRTDLGGTVRLVSDGEKITIKDNNKN